MYAIIKTGGKQYLVREGDVLRVEKLNAEEGTEVSFDEVLAINNNESLKVGTPTIEGAKVEARVIKHGKGKKITVFKYKPKELQESRTSSTFTQVQISKIMVSCGANIDILVSRDSRGIYPR